MIHPDRDPTPTIEEDARTYVKLLNSPANGWGMHICKTTGLVSHHLYRVMIDRHGEINFRDAVDAMFKIVRKEIAHDLCRHRSPENTG